MQVKFFKVVNNPNTNCIIPTGDITHSFPHSSDPYEIFLLLNLLDLIQINSYCTVSLSSVKCNVSGYVKDQ